MYLGRFNSCQHCRGQRCASTRCEFIDTKIEGVVFWTHSQLQSCGARWEVYNHRPTSAYMTYREHFQYCKDPMRAIPNPFRKVCFFFFGGGGGGGGGEGRLLGSLTLHFSRPTSQELALALKPTGPILATVCILENTTVIWNAFRMCVCIYRAAFL